MKYRLKKHNKRQKSVITLESSKSESNRALIISALAGGEPAHIHNLSNARDTQTMLRLLSNKQEVYDVMDAGTTMRFLTAYLAIKGQDVVITGTERMKQRPIGPLVDSLRLLGAKIDYMEKDGYPPLRIGQIEDQSANEIAIPGNISSQYISALLMIAPLLPDGLNVSLTTEVYSRPYIQMTLDLMRSFGVTTQWEGSKISVAPQRYAPSTYTIEGDWSGASYWYSFLALAEKGSTISLSPLRDHSSQGDRAIADIMSQMGVSSQFESDQVNLAQIEAPTKTLDFDFRNCPDLGQTVMVVAAAIGITLKMTGLESLKIKETDRIMAMQNELAKIGAALEENGNKWLLTPSSSLPGSVHIETYEDHRMAMAFAPLCMLMDVTIDDPKVVEKSYPGFWQEIERFGVEIEEI